MIVISGHAQKSETDSDFGLARLDKHGKLDRSFGDRGKVMTDFSNLAPDGIQAMAIQPDGGIIAAGPDLPMAGTIDFALTLQQVMPDAPTTFATSQNLSVNLLFKKTLSEIDQIHPACF